MLKSEISLEVSDFFITFASEISNGTEDNFKNNSIMEQRPTTAEIAMADYYRQYCGGFAYIPFQDLNRYEKAFKKVIAYNKDNK